MESAYAHCLLSSLKQNVFTMDCFLTTLVFMVAICTAGAVKCYKCGGVVKIASEDRCLDNFDPELFNDTSSDTCEGKYCVKTKFVTLGLEQLVQRYCSDEDITEGLEFSEYKCRTSKEPMTYCACDGEFCNGASSYAVSVSLMVSAGVSVLLMCRMW